MYDIAQICDRKLSDDQMLLGALILHVLYTITAWLPHYACTRTRTSELWTAKKGTPDRYGYPAYDQVANAASVVVSS